MMKVILKFYDEQKVTNFRYTKTSCRKMQQN